VRCPGGRPSCIVILVRGRRIDRRRFDQPGKEVRAVSIIRVGLSETKKFAEGYDAIFGKKKEGPAKAGKGTPKKAAAKKKRKNAG
jgi:hypothetical protein